MNPQDSYAYTHFEPGSFWARRRKVVRSNTLPFQLEMLRTTGRYDAFDLKWHPTYDNPPTVWPVPNHLFWDSDVAKWIEGVAYFPDAGEEDKESETAVVDLVSKIRKAQQPDGYLNIHFTVVEPEKRFSNLRDLHELYNAGHLIEGALAHARRYKSKDLLEPLEKYVHLLSKTFGPGGDQKHGYPGHPEIELALLRLYKRTKNTEYLQLARYFIEERGNPKGTDGQHYYDVEAKARGESDHTLPLYYPAPRSYWYNQAHKPILEQETIEGHSVRAMYLLTAVADLALIDQKDFGKKYQPALRRLWENMVYQKMYLTGGIGAMKKWEGFGIDYFLPQGSDEGGCYSETCAAIGVMMLAERLLQLDLDGEYGDILERCLYNAMLTGMSIDGRGFTYVNQMASSPGNPSKREEWFECACCPPNVARVLGHLGGYLWTVDTTEKESTAINVHLYASATLEHELENDKKIKLTQSTDWPWEGTVKFSLESSADTPVTIRLRIPSWASTSNWSITPSPEGVHVEKGYLTLPPSYTSTHSTFTLEIPFTPRLIRPHPFTNQSIVVLARGPIIYCIEDRDHEWVNDDFKTLVIPGLNNEENEKKFLEELKIEKKEDLPEGEGYIGITAPKAGQFLKLDSTIKSVSSTSKPLSEAPGTNGENAAVEGGSSKTEGGKEGKLDYPSPSALLSSEKEGGKGPVDLHFIPYFARANRGGKGMMRVGLRVV